jgi:hypothetical protein
VKSPVKYRQYIELNRVKGATLDISATKGLLDISVGGY